jgi:Deoxyribonuclease NucA/NucB
MAIPMSSQSPKIAYIFAVTLLFHAFHGLAAGSDIGNFYAPGRADRMLHRRAGKDFGTFKVDCAGAEGACNNACYYINCQTRGNPDANKITYIGPNGNNGEDDHNRYESGCQAQQGGSVCGNYPFSQKFIEDQSQAGNYDCDEWPPAASQQDPFDKKKYKNSLRCMPQGENRSLGSKLGNYINGRGGPYPGRPAGVMSRDDYFKVEFDISKADKTKVKFCQGQGTTMCGSDGLQFGMTVKKTQNGKISAQYDPKGTDNHYALQNTVYKDIFQCSIEMTRDGDRDFKDVKLFNWENSDVTQTHDCTISGATGTCVLKGLPNDLTISKTGNVDSKIGFEYADAQKVNHFKWDSESTGDGRGPATDDGEPLRFCKVKKDGNKREIECWFPCYEKKDGK